MKPKRMEIFTKMRNNDLKTALETKEDTSLIVQEIWEDEHFLCKGLLRNQ